MERLLEVKDLVVRFRTYRGIVKALNGVTFDVNKGEVVGLAGETGSGKTVTGFTIMRLLPPNAIVANGSILFNGTDLLKLDSKEMSKIRGKKITAIFQDPHTYLNPVFRIGDQFVDVLTHHMKNEDKNRPEIKREAWSQAIEMLREVGMPAPENVMRMYPHELSGGMKQRVMIAMAFSLKPELVIADEPTTALDVSIQAQVLEIMKEIQKKYNTSVIFITHDLGVIAEIARRVAIMYAGRIVEFGKVEDVFKEPLHPYTKGLLSALPRVDKDVKPQSISGTVPDLVNPPSGCAFHPRCKYVMNVCREVIPRFIEVQPEHYVACHLYTEGYENA
ncbi:MAG: ABC transporter ATP-binding protein [Thermoprotei archaeon]